MQENQPELWNKALLCKWENGIAPISSLVRRWILNIEQAQGNFSVFSNSALKCVPVTWEDAE